MLKYNVVKEIHYKVGSMKIGGFCCGAKDNKSNITLCLHGWLDNAASFSPLFPYLQHNLTNKHIIAIDWLGHGSSSHKSIDAHYHFIDWVYDLMQLFEIQQWKQVDIIAHSMGGMVASAFSAAFPERVKSLTLIDTIGFLNEEADQTTKQLRKGILSRLKSTKFNRKKGISKKKFHLNIESAVKARINVSDLQYEHAKLIVERGLIKIDEGYYWCSDEKLRNISPYRLTLSQAEQLIKDIKCPVQLIYGDKGMEKVISGIKTFGSLIENFSSHKLKGGHHVHMEHPEQTVELIKSHINQTEK